MTTTALDLSNLAPDHSTTTAHVLDLERGGERLVVAYVLCANGEFCYSREQARWALARPGNRGWYFCKIESHAAYETDEKRPLALATCKKILSEVVPPLVKEHFPTPADLKRR